MDKETFASGNTNRLSRRQIAWLVANEIPDGSYVNLGIGIPTLCADHMPEEKEILLHSENGVLGFGPRPDEGEEDADLVNAGKQPITMLKGGSYFVHSDAFGMIRGGHIDIAMLGAFEVSGNGDLANWTTNNPTFPPGVGGAMDLAAGAKEVWVLTEHQTKDGGAKIVNKCSYPLTSARCVKRIYTDLAIMSIGDDELIVEGMVEGMSLEELQQRTEPKLRLSDSSVVLSAPDL
jgi:3-oxoadipate CoA-transferase beta subunit